MSQISIIVSRLIEHSFGSPTHLAADLGVSETSVNRWLQGKARPRPTIEARLHYMAGRIKSSAMQVQEEAALYHAPDERESLGTALDTTLREVREILHRRSRLSSRNEALEEVGVLLFAHMHDVREGGAGLSSIRSSKAFHTGKAAEALHDLIEAKLRIGGLSDLFINGHGKYLKLGSDEDAVAKEVIEAFTPLHRHEKLLRTTGYDILNEVFGKFISDSFIDEKEFGQYLTPPEVVSFMAEVAAHVLQPAEYSLLMSANTSSNFSLILDPSCGVGSFLTAAAIAICKRIKQEKNSSSDKPSPNTILSLHCVGIDKSERMIKLAKLNFAMFGQQQPRLFLSNALARAGVDGKIAGALEGKARLILTNPPFGANFRENDLLKYRIATSWAQKFPGSADSEVLFLERYVDWLMPGGHLLAIVPDSVLTNKGIYSDLRRGLAQTTDIVSVVSLPPVAFASAGTTTKTSILHLQKHTEPRSKARPTIFAVCKTLGFEVVTRGNQRVKRSLGSNDLPMILQELLSNETNSQFVTHNQVALNASRWDAQHHSSLSAVLHSQLNGTRNKQLRIRDVAELVNERTNPLRFNTKTFKYIEISDIDLKEFKAIAKNVETANAPSRARKIALFGDVLVSTVRPERGAVGVVIETAGPVICTTGLAVLRPLQIQPFVLAQLLSSKYVIEQLVRNNVGIAYPAIEEDVLPDILLPVQKADLPHLNELGLKVLNAEKALKEIHDKFRRASAEVEDAWIRGIVHGKSQTSSREANQTPSPT